MGSSHAAEGVCSKKYSREDCFLHSEYDLTHVIDLPSQRSIKDGQDISKGQEDFDFTRADISFGMHQIEESFFVTEVCFCT